MKIFSTKIMLLLLVTVLLSCEQPIVDTETYRNDNFISDKVLALNLSGVTVQSGAVRFDNRDTYDRVISSIVKFSEIDQLSFSKRLGFTSFFTKFKKRAEEIQADIKAGKDINHFKDDTYVQTTLYPVLDMNFRDHLLSTIANSDGIFFIGNYGFRLVKDKEVIIENGTIGQLLSVNPMEQSSDPSITVLSLYDSAGLVGGTDDSGQKAEGVIIPDAPSCGSFLGTVSTGNTFNNTFGVAYTMVGKFATPDANRGLYRLDYNIFSKGYTKKFTGALGVGSTTMLTNHKILALNYRFTLTDPHGNVVIDHSRRGDGVESDQETVEFAEVLTYPNVVSFTVSSYKHSLSPVFVSTAYMGAPAKNQSSARDIFGELRYTKYSIQDYPSIVTECKAETYIPESMK